MRMSSIDSGSSGMQANRYQQVFSGLISSSMRLAVPYTLIGNALRKSPVAPNTVDWMFAFPVSQQSVISPLGALCFYRVWDSAHFSTSTLANVGGVHGLCCCSMIRLWMSDMYHTEPSVIFWLVGAQSTPCWSVCQLGLSQGSSTPFPAACVSLCLPTLVRPDFMGSTVALSKGFGRAQRSAYTLLFLFFRVCTVCVRACVGVWLGVCVHIRVRVHVNGCVRVGTCVFGVPIGPDGGDSRPQGHFSQ